MRESVFPLTTSQPGNANDISGGGDHWYEVGELLATLYAVVDRLESIFPGLKFTPDGQLVGSIGEVIAAHMFKLTLYPNSTPTRDAITEDGQMVYIKFTQNNKKVALRAEPEHLLVLRLTPDRCFDVVYNGKGREPWQNSGKIQKNGQRPIRLSLLRKIDAAVIDRDRIPLCNEINLARPIRS